VEVALLVWTILLPLLKKSIDEDPNSTAYWTFVYIVVACCISIGFFPFHICLPNFHRIGSTTTGCVSISFISILSTSTTATVGAVVGSDSIAQQCAAIGISVALTPFAVVKGTKYLQVAFAERKHRKIHIRSQGYDVLGRVFLAFSPLLVVFPPNPHHVRLSNFLSFSRKIF
jgi:hypothetical protein